MVDPRSYIEAIAAELTRIRGTGLVLSPVEAQLALSWHASGVTLDDVLGELRKVKRLRPTVARGAVQVGLSLQLIERSVAQRKKPRDIPPQPGATAPALWRAAQEPGLPARAEWEKLALRADDLLAEGGDAYWDAAFAALRSSLREMPRAAVASLGRDLRVRMAPRPSSMSRACYRKSLRLQLLSAASERKGVPPRAFLL
jgi:hypothetical protein